MTRLQWLSCILTGYIESRIDGTALEMIQLNTSVHVYNVDIH